MSKGFDWKACCLAHGCPYLKRNYLVGKARYYKAVCTNRAKFAKWESQYDLYCDGNRPWFCKDKITLVVLDNSDDTPNGDGFYYHVNHFLGLHEKDGHKFRKRS